MDTYTQPGTPYDQLTPAQRVQADTIFLGVKMHEHTYAVSETGNVQLWRYYIPSATCQEMIVKAVTGK